MMKLRSFSDVKMPPEVGFDAGPRRNNRLFFLLYLDSYDDSLALVWQ